MPTAGVSTYAPPSPPRVLLSSPIFSFLFQVNKLTVMRSMVRAVSFPRTGRTRLERSSSSSSSRSSTSSASPSAFSANGTLADGEDLGGLIYSHDEEVPDTRYSAQLRRYRALVSRAKMNFVQAGAALLTRPCPAFEELCGEARNSFAGAFVRWLRSLEPARNASDAPFGSMWKFCDAGVQGCGQRCQAARLSRG